MLWVLKRTVSLRRFFEHPKHMLKMMDKNIIAILRSFFLNWPYVDVNIWSEPSPNCMFCGRREVMALTKLLANVISDPNILCRPIVYC